MKAGACGFCGSTLGGTLGAVKDQQLEIARLRYAVAELEAQHSREYFRARELERAVACALKKATLKKATLEDYKGRHLARVVGELKSVPKCGTCRDGSRPIHQVSCTACGRGCLDMDVDIRNGKPWPKRKRGKS